jgi:thiamine-phosphate pyrophosphorylase
MTIHLVTDRRRLSAGPSPEDVKRCLLQQAREAAEAGIDVLQLREADLDARHLTEISVDMLMTMRGTSTRLIVNDRLDVALAVGADGVHLPGAGLAPEAVRRLAPPGFLIGRSVHDAGEAARSAGADYLVAGTVWATPSKPGGRALLGLSGLRSIVQAARVPVLAIGGVTDERVADVASTGAAGVAGIGLFLGQADASGCRARPLVDLVRSLRARFDTPGSGS